MKVAVTAASGQLGEAIVMQLIDAIGKENVVGIARTTSKAEHLGVEIRKGDYNSEEEFIEALKGIDVVMLVSGMDHPDKRIGQHRNVINAASKAGVGKLVYSSIIGDDGTSTFDAIVKSNRQTEQDIKESGMAWAIGRNGLYIEPDVEFMENYKKDGKIINCAGEGLCSYTMRSELAYAYAQLILNDNRNGRVFNLAGEPISQNQLTDYLNNAFGTALKYEAMTPEAYITYQKELNGDFLGSVIAGIYTKIKNGEFNIQSDFTEAAGRLHIGWDDYFNNLN